MATTTSSVLRVLVALRDQLALRAGLAGVAVSALPVRVEDLGREWIVVATEVPGEQTFPFTSGMTKHETFQLNGVLGAVRPGAGDETGLEVMAIALEILGEVEACLREDPRIDGTALVSELAEFRHQPGVTDLGRIHQIEFTISVQARLVSS